jgi:RNA polymerase sigma factor (sigma-70 family)
MNRHRAGCGTAQDVSAIMSNQKKKSADHAGPAMPADAEEQALFERCLKGDEKARDILLEKYSPWAVNLARKYHACFPQVALSELVAEGNRGILEALKRFDPSRRAKFSTYAWFWILKNIQEYITTSAGLIDVPRSVVSDLRKIVKAMDGEIKKGNTPSFDSLARKLKLDSGTIRALLTDKENVGRPVSLDKFLNEDDRTDVLSDLIEDKSQAPMQEIIDQAGDRTAVSSVLEQLEPEEREVIRLRFGFIDNRFYSLKEAGSRMKMAPAKVKDIESIALFKLRKLLSERENDD